MIAFLARKNLEKRLMLMIMACSALIMVLAMAGFILHDIYLFKNSLGSKLSVLADTIGHNSKAALTSRDRAAARETLSALKADPDIIEAQIITKNGRIFASYPNKITGAAHPLTKEILGLAKQGTPRSSEHSLVQFDHHHIDVVRPIYLHGEWIGLVFIQASLRMLFNRILWSAALYSGIFLLLIGLAFILSHRLAGATLQPIRNLLQTMQEVGDRQNYHVRARVESPNELGVLSQRFNDMLDQIEKRDNALSEAKNKLEQEMRERQQMERQLRHAHTMQAIGTLASGIAHDFNNILAAILGYAEMILLQYEGKDERLAHDIQVIINSSTRAKSLVKQLLTFSRQSREQNAADLLLAPLVKEVAKLLRASAPAAIELTTSLADSCYVHADPTQIYQILTNLGANAVHAMENNGGVLELGLAQTELEAQDCLGETEVKPGKYIHLWVKDTGQGIDPLIQNHIFEPYFTTKPMERGTGMGLAVVHGIVKRLNGIIRFESQLEKGTTFHVYLPATVPNSLSIPPQLFDAGPQSPPTGHENILLVDDEVFVREAAKRLLQQFGYTVSTAEDGATALELFRSRPDTFALVITDQTMPRMSGVDLARKILEIKPSQAIVMMSGYGPIINAEQAKSFGFRGYLSKPFDRSMINKIRKVLDGNTTTANQ